MPWTKPANFGGKQPGAGRPKGSRDERSLNRERSLAQVKALIQRKAEALVSAQFSIALGSGMLFRIDTPVEGAPRQKPVLVDDPQEVIRYFDELHGENGTVEGSYYFITTSLPENAAIDSLLNRAFGRAKESVELSGPDGTPVQVAIVDRLQAARKRVGIDSLDQREREA